MTVTDSITVTYTVENTTSAAISVNGKEEMFTGSITKTLTGSSTVTIIAVNEKKSATKEYTYTKVEPVETTTATAVRMMPSGNVSMR